MKKQISKKNSTMYRSLPSLSSMLTRRLNHVPILRQLFMQIRHSPGRLRKRAAFLASRALLEVAGRSVSSLTYHMPHFSIDLWITMRTIRMRSEEMLISRRPRPPCTWWMVVVGGVGPSAFFIHTVDKNVSDTKPVFCMRADVTTPEKTEYLRTA